MSQVSLRAATLADLAVLQRWDAEPHVVASDPDEEWDWAAELARTPPWREQLIAEVDGRPIGCVQIIDPAEEESHYWGDCGPGLRALDIWIGEAADLGRGYGTAMMRQALARCFAAASVEAVLVDPLVENVRAHRFYQRLGFVPVGERRFGDELCLVHRLERAHFAPAAPANQAQG